MKLPQMIRNLWIYRRLLGLTVVLGIVLFFVVSNSATVEVTFPFIGTLKSWVGVVMLASAALGAVLTWLVMTFRHAWHAAKSEHEVPSDGAPAPPPKAAADDVPANTGAKQSSEGPTSAGP